MTNHNIKYLVLGLLLLLVYGCKKDILGEGEITTITPNPIITVESRVVGLVQDEAGLPLSEVKVEHIGNSIMTDENGYFSIPTVSTTVNGGYITFEKDGFFENSKFIFQLDPDDYSFLRVTMLDLGTTREIDPSNAHTVSIDNDKALIEFKADAFVDENGDVYSGTVSVFSRYIDPTSLELAEIMPGDLRGIDMNQERVQLSTFGMLATELRGENGQELQLAEGKSAEIKMLIPEELADSADPIIPTWSYDQDLGYWIEESSARLTADGYYTAEVTHFSYWNYDAPWPIVDFCARLTFLSGEPVANTKVCIKIVGSGVTKCDWTDQRGKVGGKVPLGKLLEIIVYNECGGIIYREEIGPFNEDVGTIPITIPDEKFFSVQGQLTCKGNPVTNGYVHIITDNTRHVVPTDAEGNYRLDLTDCGVSTGQVSLQGFDLDEPGIGEIEEIVPIDGMVLFSQEVCNEEDENLIVEFNGNMDVFGNPTALLINGTDLLVRSGESVASSDFLEFTIQDAFLGPDNTMSSVLGRISSNAFLCNNNVCLQHFSANLEQTGSAVGDIIVGTYEGQLPGSTETIEGSFRISIKELGQTAVISGRFYFDNNDNGMYDPGDDELLDQNPAITLTEVNGNSISNSGTLGEFEFQNVLTQREYTFTIDFSGEIDFTSETPFDLNCKGIEFNPSTSRSSTFILEDSGITCLDIPFKRTPFICEDNVTILGQAVDCNGQLASLGLFNPLDETIYFVVTSVNGSATFNITDEIGPGEFVEANVEVGNLQYGFFTNSGGGGPSTSLVPICESEIFVPTIPSIENCIDIGPVVCRGTELEIGVDFNCNVANLFPTYLWSNGATTPTITTSIDGFFTVTVTDFRGCSATSDVIASFADVTTASGYVWLDSNDSGTIGVFEETEDRLSDLTVILSEGDPSNIIDQVQTNQDGEYTFNNLIAGNSYQVSFGLPMGFEFSPKCIGNDTEVNSKIDPDSGYAEFRMECDPQISGVNSPSNLNIGIKSL